MSGTRLPVTAALLFGPRSRSFGVPKAFLPWGTGSLALQMIHKAQKHFQEVVAVSKDVDWIPRDVQGVVPLYLDRWSETGPQAGLATVLPLAGYDPVFLMSCTQPVFRERVITGMWEDWKRNASLDALVPFVNGRLYPFGSFWAKSAMRFLQPGEWGSLEDLLGKSGMKLKKVEEALMLKWDPRLESLRELENLQDWMEVGVPQD